MPVLLGMLCSIVSHPGAPELTVERLTAEPLTEGVGAHRALTLLRSGEYRAEWLSQGTPRSDAGRWTLQGRRVLLQPTSCLERGSPVDCGRSLGEARCEVLATPESLTDTHVLACASLQNHRLQDTGRGDLFPVPLPGARLSRGARRSAGGVPVVTLGLAKGRTTCRVAARSRPALRAIDVTALSDLFHAGAPTVIPADAPLVVLARSEATDTLGGTTDAWYLVDAGLTEPVWIYGRCLALAG